MNTKSILTYKTLITACLFLLFSLIQVNAQDKGIYEITNNESNNDRALFYDLALKIHPTIYVKDNVIKNIYGEGKIQKTVLQDVKSINILKTENAKFDDVKLIIIRLNSQADLNNSIDLSNSSLDNLKYIYVKSNFNAKPEDIANFVKANPSIRIFYKIELPS